MTVTAAGSTVLQLQTREKKKMPAVSQKQAIAMRIAEHAPGKLFKRNKAMASMDHKDLHDFASTPDKGLPERVGKKMMARKKK
jgi:hypothetical protein